MRGACEAASEGKENSDDMLCHMLRVGTDKFGRLSTSGNKGRPSEHQRHQGCAFSAQASALSCSPAKAVPKGQQPEALSAATAGGQKPMPCAEK